jgi:MFS family permease
MVQAAPRGRPRPCGAGASPARPGRPSRRARPAPASRRGWVFGVTATATALGNAAGPLASAWVAGAFGLRAAFLFTATALTAAGVWVALALAPRTPPHVYPARPKSDVPRPRSPATP